MSHRLEIAIEAKKGNDILIICGKEAANNINDLSNLRVRY